MSDVGRGSLGQILVSTATGTSWATYSSIVNYIDAVLVATTTTLTASYNNGVAGIGAFLLNTGSLAAFSVDGQTPAINSRVLVKDQASTLQNGVYTLTTVGSGAIAWVLTRATDFDQPSEINVGDVVPVQTGTVNANTSWMEASAVTTIGTDPITFTQFQSAPISLPVTVANGGTGRTTLTNHGVLVGATTTAITQLAAGSAGQVLQSGGASADPAYSTATYPATAGTSGKILISDGTNIVSSTPTYPNTSGTSGKVVVSDGTNNVYSTPTFPNASATTRKIIVSDGTNWVASTETYAVPGTSGNLLTSNGTNWTSAAPTSSGTVTSVSVVSANGLAGTVATATTTPAITLSTTITGVLSGNGTAISAASTTGSGNVVLATSPTLVTPVLGVASATSINFGGTTLSTYAEGTWTPTVLGVGAAGVTTYISQVGGYVRIGNLVTVTAYIDISAATGTGDVSLGGLPFTVKNVTNQRPTGTLLIYGSGTWTLGAGYTQSTVWPLTNALTSEAMISGSGVAWARLQMHNAAVTFAYSVTYQI